MPAAATRLSKRRGLKKGGDHATGMSGAPSPMQREVRVRDPASRDQDAVAFRRNRFAERVRREWNPVTTAEMAPFVAGAAPDLDGLARAVQVRVGGEAGPIRRRLEEFVALEGAGEPAASDPLVRPGAA